MKKVNRADKDELRAEYVLSDFPEGIVRGKYSKCLRASSNIIVLKPEVADVFPNAEAVNRALRSLIEIAHKATRKPKHSTAARPHPG